MTKLKLTYFNFDGGRGESIRLALTLGKVPFEDDRVTYEKWPQIKTGLPFGALPVLYVDGSPLAQSSAICRYVGKLTDMYPADPWQAALCDETLETAEEMTMLIGATIGLADEEKKLKRQVLGSESLPAFLAGLERRLLSSGGIFFANSQLTVADLRVYDLVQWLRSGILDHLPADLVDRVAPSLVQHFERVKNEPRIKDYYSKRTQTA